MPEIIHVTNKSTNGVPRKHSLIHVLRQPHVSNASRIFAQQMDVRVEYGRVDGFAVLPQHCKINPCRSSFHATLPTHRYRSRTCGSPFLPPGSPWLPARRPSGADRISCWKHKFSNAPFPWAETLTCKPRSRPCWWPRSAAPSSWWSLGAALREKIKTTVNVCFAGKRCRSTSETTDWQHTRRSTRGHQVPLVYTERTQRHNNESMQIKRGLCNRWSSASEFY